MTPQPSTSLRVRFAKAMGYRKCDNAEYNSDILWHLKGQGYLLEHQLPPIDANTVREAMMGMTEGEWLRFSCKLFESQPFELGDDSVDVITRTLKTPPPTLAELICEMRNV